MLIDYFWPFPFQGLPSQVVAPYANGGETSDQLNDLFDFSKVPDVDQVTRARMGSKWRLWASEKDAHMFVGL